jgi:hypothetical protein
MPPQAKRRTAGSKQADSPGMQIEFEGRTYVVRESDLTPRLVAELRSETGFAGWVGLATEARRGVDLDVIAAYIWLARRMTGEVIAYQSVLDGMSYSADLDVKVEDKRTKAAEGDSPEA